MKHVVNHNDGEISLNKSICDSLNHMGLDKSSGKKPEHAKTVNNVRNNGQKLKLIKQVMALKQIKIQLLL